MVGYPITSDHRDNKSIPVSSIHLWAVATDKTLSGWGLAPHKSYVAYPINGLSNEQQKKAIEWLESRRDFRYVRINLELPRLHNGDHLSIYDLPEQITK